MTRINHISALIALAIMIASTGCGDASSFDETADDAVSASDTTPTLDDELELACEGYCDVSASCRGALVREGCAERCANEYGPEADDTCIVAQIDMLNCYSATSCDDSTVDVHRECIGAGIALRSECGLSGLRRDLDEDGVLEVIEVGDGEWADVGVDPEETDTSEGSDDEEPDESEDSGPIFELPEIPEHPEIPEIGPVIEFP